MILHDSVKNNCVICGNSSCEQSYDHCKLDYEGFFRLFQSNKVTNDRINEILQRVGSYYHDLIQSMVKILKQDEKKVIGKIKSMEYLFLQNKKINMGLVQDLCTGNYQQCLPTKKVIRLIEQLNQTHSRSTVIDKQHNLQKLIDQFLNTQTINQQLKRLSDHLLFPVILSQQKRRLSLKKRVSIRKIENPEQIEKDQQMTINIKGITLRQNCKQILLSNRNIQDKQLVQHINSIKNFKNMTKLQLRNNRITQLSCRIIGNNLSHLLKLDLRGNNKLKNDGIIFITQKIKKLIEFYVCETGIDDAAVNSIYENLKQLNLLYMEKNNITVKGLQRIVDHKKIKTLSLIGNKISKQQIQRIRTVNLRGRIMYLNA